MLCSSPRVRVSARVGGRRSVVVQAKGGHGGGSRHTTHTPDIKHAAYEGPAFNDQAIVDETYDESVEKPAHGVIGEHRASFSPHAASVGLTTGLQAD